MVRAVNAPPVAAGIEHTWRPGVMTRRDLRRYTAPERKPVRNGATTAAEPAFLTSREGRALALAPYNHRFTTISPPEIGAATAIEFGRRGRMLAAAEPTRRGGGSAMVVKER